MSSARTPRREARSRNALTCAGVSNLAALSALESPTCFFFGNNFSLVSQSTSRSKRRGCGHIRKLIDCNTVPSLEVRQTRKYCWWSRPTFPAPRMILGAFRFDILGTYCDVTMLLCNLHVSRRKTCCRASCAAGGRGRIWTRLVRRIMRGTTAKPWAMCNMKLSNIRRLPVLRQYGPHIIPKGHAIMVCESLTRTMCSKATPFSV